MSYFTGIDIGSTASKVVVLDESGIVDRFVLPTGWNSKETAAAIAGRLAQSGRPVGEDMKVIATGYGRICVEYAGKTITEITCHARGGYALLKRDCTIVDVGGQDTKVITVVDGASTNFLMNDKCSAGTGRFLEIMANTLAVRPEELCQMAAQGGNTSISSMCTVFAESEVISLIGRGERRENIAFAVVDSIVKKVASQAGRMSAAPAAVCLTGGLCEYPYLRQSLSAALGRPVEAAADGRYAGAVGAALSAFLFKS